MSTVDNKQLIKVVSGYSMPKAARQLVSLSQPLVICGTTAAGKDTVLRDLMKRGGYKNVISHTTRQPRLNGGVMEQDGRDYYFVDKQTLEKMVIQHQFIEVKAVHHDFYGTSLDAYDQIVKDGKIPALVIDVQGALELLAALPSLRPVFVVPPSYDVWRQRLAGRGDMSLAELKRRLQSAVTEITSVLNTPAFDLVLNDDIGSAAEAIYSHAVGRQPVILERIQVWLASIEQALARL